MEQIHINHSRVAEKLLEKWYEGKDRGFPWWWVFWNKHQRIPGLRSTFVIDQSGISVSVDSTLLNDEVRTYEQVRNAFSRCASDKWVIDEDRDHNIHFFLLKKGDVKPEFPSISVYVEGGTINRIELADAVVFKDRLVVILCFLDQLENYDLKELEMPLLE